MNPFHLNPKCVEETLMDWRDMSPIPYDKNNTDPYTKARIILMNGTEFEMNWFSHQANRHIDNNELRRQLALIRRSEKMQQMPGNNVNS